MKRLIPIAIIISSANVFADEPYQHLGCKDESGAYQGLNGGNCENPVIIQEYVLDAKRQKRLDELLQVEIERYNKYQLRLDGCLEKQALKKSQGFSWSCSFDTERRDEQGMKIQGIEIEYRSNPKYYVNCAVMLKKLSNSHNLLNQELPSCYNPNYDFKPLFKVTTQ